MPVTPCRLGRSGRATLAALSLGLAGLGLAGCGGQSGEKFAPVCPAPSIPRDFNDIHRYRGTGRDIVDSVLDGRITDVSGSCTRDGDGVVVTTISVGLQLTRGPAAPGRTADLGYFVAVSEGERILDKQVFRLHADFPANTDRLRLSGDEVQLRLPVSPTKTAAAYRISVGFELTPAELAINRQRAPVR